MILNSHSSKISGKSIHQKKEVKLSLNLLPLWKQTNEKPDYEKKISIFVNLNFPFCVFDDVL